MVTNPGFMEKGKIRLLESELVQDFEALALHVVGKHSLTAVWVYFLILVLFLDLLMLPQAPIGVIP